MAFLQFPSKNGFILSTAILNALYLAKMYL